MIHPTAVVDPKSCLGKDVQVGPYCVIGPEVVLKEKVALHSHVVVTGKTTLEEGCKVFPFASLGHAPQDKKYAGEASRVVIGARTILREYVTVQPGTQGGTMETSVGSDCLLMAGVHVAHDCAVGDRVVMANNATLGGHVIIGDDTVIGGLAAVHQFVQIGCGVMVSGMTGLGRDVMPYTIAGPGRSQLSGLNLVGLKRLGAGASDTKMVREIYRALFESSDGTLGMRFQGLPAIFRNSSYGVRVIDFVQKSLQGNRGLCFPVRDNDKSLS